jgi:hypothetical protein
VGDSYTAYGQQTYIFDVLSAIRRRGHRVQLYVDDPRMLAITGRLREQGIPIVSSHSIDAAEKDCLIVDEVRRNDWVEHLCRMRFTKVVHNPNAPGPDRLLVESATTIAMTRNAFTKLQRRGVPDARLRLVPQGVDLERFSVVNQRSAAKSTRRAIVLGRTTTEKLPNVEAVLRHLRARAWTVHAFGHQPPRIRALVASVTILPWYSVPACLETCDLVVTSGRGAMEACAAGAPTLCAGLGYGGLVHLETVESLLERNLTGYGRALLAPELEADIDRASTLSIEECRAVAERHFDVERTVDGLLAASGGP